MDDFRLSIYVEELVHQGETAELAASAFDAALSAEDGTRTLFAEVQSLLSAAAMMSRFLWFTDEGKKRRHELGRERASALRAALGIVESNPPALWRGVRNAFEHFDERLDAYFDAGHSVAIRWGVGPRGSVVVEGQTQGIFRYVESDTLNVYVLDESVSLQELFLATQDVRSRAAAWAAEYAERRFGG